MVAPYVPPAYKNYGKTTKDLLSKKFDYDSNLKLVSRSPAGITIESVGTYANSAWRGTVKFVQKQAFNKQGDAELNLSTDDKAPVSGKFTFNKYQGAVASMEGTTKDKDKLFGGTATVGLNADYATQYFASTVNVKSSPQTKTTKVELSGSTGAEGLSIGGNVSLNVTNGADILDANAGIEYTPDKRSTYSIYSSRYFDEVNIAASGRLSTGQLVGGIVTAKLEDPSKAKTQVGVEHALNASTLLKSKVELPTGVVDSCIEYRLNNPRITLGFAARFNGQSLIKGTGVSAADKFGITATWGDW